MRAAARQMFHENLTEQAVAPFASLKKQAEILFRLICCERKILFDWFDEQ